MNNDHKKEYEITDEDINWLILTKKVINIDDFIRKDSDKTRIDIDSNVQFLFKEQLKQRRREMKPFQRERTKNPVIRRQRLYPFAHERQYRRYLFDLMDVYSNIAIPEIRENLPRWIRDTREDSKGSKDSKKRNDDFNDEFQRLINDLNTTQFNMFNPDGKGVEGEKNFFSNTAILGTLTALGFAISDFNKKQEDKFTKQILGTPFSPGEPWLNDVITAWSNNNFTLIKSLTGEYIKKVNTIVNEGIVSDKSSKAIAKDIMNELRDMDKNMTRSRAKLIARDQVGKLNGRLTKRRNQEAGLNLYTWLTARDERVRTSHIGLHNKICRWDDGSVFAENTNAALEGGWKSRSSFGLFVGIPGEDIQCRCTSSPVIAELIKEIDEEIEQEIAA